MSPGLNTSEINLTTTIPSVATTTGAIVGVFNWGPVKERILISSETNLINRFGKPNDENAETFFSASDFLAYSNSLWTVRVVSSTAYNAGVVATQIINETDAKAVVSTDFVAKYPGLLGNNIKTSVCPSAAAFSSAVSGINISLGATIGTSVTIGKLAKGDILRVGNATLGYQNLNVLTVTGTDFTFTPKYRLSTALSAHTGTRFWGQYKSVSKAPLTNSIHVAVIDETGEISGIADSVLEIYEDVSILPTAKTYNGATNYYQNVIDLQSNWVYSTGVVLSAAGDAEYISFSGGTNGDNESTINLGDMSTGIDLFISPNDVDISLFVAGKSNGTGVANYIIDNICDIRKDCMVFISPQYSDVVNNIGNEATSIIAFRESLTYSSYGFMDTGYKYRYDKYNDKYRYTPLNGDIAGIVARTDNIRDPWFSPAGYQRGGIKNIIKLAYNPNKSERDELYPNDINAVISQKGAGIILFGDKTLEGLNTDFSRINVRRLFIVLEKSISIAAKKSLFDFNDEYSRAQFRNMVEPKLRDVQGRRGLYDFKVVCDKTNNTPVVIDSEQFIGDIYLKPTKAINFIQLNFVAVRTGVAFNEIVGRQ